MTEMNHCKVLAVALATSLLALMEPAGASSPGENGKIAFTSFRDGDAEVYVMRADGSDVRRLVGVGSFDHWPTWGR